MANHEDDVNIMCLKREEKYSESLCIPDKKICGIHKL